MTFPTRCTMSRVTAACLGGLLLAMAGNSWAGPFDDLEARRAIVELRTRLEATNTTNQRMLADVAKSRDDVARYEGLMLDVTSRLEALRTELQKLRAQGEQQTREMADIRNAQLEAGKQTSERFAKLEPVKVANDNQEFMAGQDEKRDFEGGLRLFRAGDYRLAALVFGDFSRRYPQSGYLPSALFWQGSAQYAQKQCGEATQAFRAIPVLAPQHLRVPDAKLGIADCELEMNEGPAAKRTLEALIASHPKSEAASTAKSRLRTGKFAAAAPVAAPSAQ